MLANIRTDFPERLGLSHCGLTLKHLSLSRKHCLGLCYPAFFTTVNTALGLTVMFTYSVALNPVRSLLSRAPCQLTKDSQSHVGKACLFPKLRNEDKASRVGQFGVRRANLASQIQGQLASCVSPLLGKLEPTGPRETSSKPNCPILAALSSPSPHWRAAVLQGPVSFGDLYAQFTLSSVSSVLSVD